MKLVFMPPLIFAHRVYLERGDRELSLNVLRENFGEGSGATPGLHQRWMRGTDSKSRPAANTYGVFYGFRAADDAVLFFLTHSGKK